MKSEGELMKRQLQGIALILFSLVATINFELLRYNYIFDLDLSWKHIFLLIAVGGLVLCFINPRTGDKDE